MDNKKLILTATRHLTEQLSEKAPSRNAAMQVLQLSQWITRLSNPSLSESQEHAVWQLIIANSLPHLAFLQHAQLASMAQQAWHLIKQWDVPLSHLSFENNNDTRLFKQWARQFIHQCKQHKWLDASSAIEAYIALPHHVPESLTLVGFTELTPQQKRLLHALSTQGCRYEILEKTQSSNAKRIALTDPESECQTMARWAAQILKQHPDYRIACIVPQLTENRIFIEDIFLKLKLPFIIATPQTLDTYPLIRCALSILSITDEMPKELIETLLHSPFVKYASIQNTSMQSTMTAQQEKSPSAWCVFFGEQLNAWGWPGNRTLDVLEQQLFDQWKIVLTEFSALDSVLPMLSFDGALQQLLRLISTTSLQHTEITPNVIPIYAPLDAIGLSFDALWIMGIQDTVWPPAPRPNPFIPLVLQRTLRMPYASADQTLIFYQKITTVLCAQAPSVIMSCALRNADGELRPSRLIQALPEITLSDLSLLDYQHPAQHMFDAAQTNTPLEWIIDDNAPSSLSDEVSRGGTAIFKNQSACPFRAFAQHRLGAKEIDSPSAELNYKERGTILHQILEKIWIRLQDQEQLCHLSETELKTFVQTCINQILLRFSEKREIPLKKQFQKIEAQRLENLVLKWLQLEKERSFFTVKAVEKKQTLQLGQYPIQMRIDRIDELSDGSHVIIDYKTGEYSENAWYGERPDEPQMPLYCLSSEHPVMGAGVAQIMSGNIALKGVIADSATSMGIKSLKPIPHWETLINDWENMLKNLVQQFESGYARVDPKDPTKTCQYCHLSMVCRIKEQL